MRINTRLNRIELTKRERETLISATALLSLIAKHAEDTPSTAASNAVAEIGVAMEALTPVDESTLVGAK